MNSIVFLVFFCFPCFPKSMLTKYVRSVRPSIVSIIRNHPTDLLLQNADKNAHEKFTILRKNADGYAVTSLTLNSFVCVFISFWVFCHEHLRITGLQGKGKAISLTPSLLLPPATRAVAGKLWFPGTSKSFHLYVTETVHV